MVLAELVSRSHGPAPLCWSGGASCAGGCVCGSRLSQQGRPWDKARGSPTTPARCAMTSGLVWSSLLPPGLRPSRRGQAGTSSPSGHQGSLCSQSSFPNGFQAEITGPPKGSDGLPRLQQMPCEVPEDEDTQLNVTVPCCSQAEEAAWGGRELGVEAAASRPPPGPRSPLVDSGSFSFLGFPPVSQAFPGAAHLQDCIPGTHSQSADMLREVSRRSWPSTQGPSRSHPAWQFRLGPAPR